MQQKLSASDRITKARVRMLLKHGFFGQIATRLQLVEEPGIPTAAVDGKRFYYNADFVQKLTDDELVFLVGHEVGHCVWQHFLRRGDRRRDVWNMAGDFVINQILVDERIGAQIKAVPILLDSKYRGMASEEVYEELMKNAVKIQATLDIHMDGDGNEEGDGEGKGFKGEPLSEEEKKALSDELKEAVLQAAQASGAGNIPRGFQRLINDITAPKMNWRDMLKIQLNSIIKNDYSFMRPNRKGWHIGAVLPGMLPGDEVNVAIAIDTSGSISESMLKDFLSEIAGIMDQFDSYIVRIFQFDTHVYGEELFSSDSNSDIRTYEVHGGGGTDFEVIFTHLKKEDVTPNQLVVFTDGEPWGSWGDADYCDTLWIVHSNPNKKAPFGITTHYEA